MSDGIGQELLFFLKAALTGIGLLAAYDIFRIFRRILRHGAIGVAVEDFVYWFCSGFIIFYILLKENNGRIRWFFVAGIVCGMVLYNISISQYVVRFLSFIIKKVLDVAWKYLVIISKPIRFIVKKLAYVTKRNMQFSKLIGRNIKKGLKSVRKAVKIGLVKK